MENYSSTVIVKDQSRNQFIYASQNYGTFYTVFAKFKNENDNIESIDFELINHKGNLNIGLAGDSSSNCKIFIKRDGDILFIGLPLKATTRITKVKINSDDFFGGVNISTNGIKEVFVFRGLISFGISTEQESSNFDSEFYFREGLHIPHELRPKEVNVKYGYFSDMCLWEDFVNNLPTDRPDSFGDIFNKENFLLTPSTNCRVGRLKNL